MNKEKFFNLSENNESEIESRIITVGSNKGHRILIVFLLILLIFCIYYFYFNSSFINKKESFQNIIEEQNKQNFQELKEKLNLEQIPDNNISSQERIIDDFSSLPPISIPEVIPEVKNDEEKILPKEEEKNKKTSVLNIPLQNENLISNITENNSPISFPSIGRNSYPRDRRSTQMLLFSSFSNNNIKSNKSSIDFLSNTSAQSTLATKLGGKLTITQGKVIDAILETAISSDLQGILRAVVSSNVYSEIGDIPLIPKGSKLIGSYSFDSNISKARININWNRIILPNGIDIIISSPGIDELGKAGIEGIIDNKIMTALFSSILLAGFSVSSAIVGQKASNFIDSLNLVDIVKSFSMNTIDFYSLKDIIKPEKEIPIEKWKLSFKAIEKIKNAKNEYDLLELIKEEIAKALDIKKDKISLNLEDISKFLRQFQKKSRSIYEEMIKKSIDNFSKDMRDIVNRSVDKKPTVYVNQGTALKVFVNQDIIFPLKSIFY